MSRVAVQRVEGMTSYKLSRIVAELESVRGVKKPVLRVLADHYPNIFPSMETIAMQAGFGTTQTRAALRVLEASGFISPLSAKQGGRQKGTQYALNVGKILALHNGESNEETQRLPLPLEVEYPTAPDTKGNGSRTETQRLPTLNPTAPVAKQRSNRESKERREQANGANAAALSQDSLKSKPERLDVEGDAVRLEATIRTWGVPLTAKVQKIIRRRLREGTGLAILECGINSTMKAMPHDERKPQFYLGQNLDAEVEAFLQYGEAAWEATVEEEAQITAMAASHGGVAPQRVYPQLPRSSPRCNDIPRRAELPVSDR